MPVPNMNISVARTTRNKPAIGCKRSDNVLIIVVLIRRKLRQQVSINRVNHREEIGSRRDQNVFAVRRKPHIAPFVVAFGEIANGGKWAVLILASIVQLQLVFAGSDAKHQRFWIDAHGRTTGHFANGNAATLPEIPEPHMAVDGGGHERVVEVRLADLRDAVRVPVKRPYVCIVVQR